MESSDHVYATSYYDISLLNLNAAVIIVHYGKTHENSVTTFFQIYLPPLDFILFFRNILVHCYLGKVTRIQTE